MKHHSILMQRLLLCVLLSSLLPSLAYAAAPPAVIDNLSFSGQADPEQASFILKGRLKGTTPEDLEPKLIYSLQPEIKIQVEPTNTTHACALTARVFQG